MKLKLFKHIIPMALVVLVLFMINRQLRLEKENKRLAQNQNELILSQSDKVAYLQLKSKEMQNTLNTLLPELAHKIDSAGIRPKNIERVVYQKTVYRDTAISRVLDTLIPQLPIANTAEPITIPFVDANPCLVVGGNILLDGERVALDINRREFKNINEVVSHLERRRWKLFGLIPTRLFGKKQIEVTVFNQCGETETKILTKVKGRWRPIK